MNEILKKRINNIPYRITRIGNGANDAYNEGARYGAEYILSHQWISVDEALSEEDSNVSMNVYVEVDTGHGIEHCVFLATYVLGKFSCETTRVKVIAWMPIPKFELNKPE